MFLSGGREMEAISSGRGLARILVSVAVLLISNTILAYADECSIAKTNASCTLTIDRRNPLAPPTIQMYPGQTLTVVVRNPYYFERYFMDYTSGQVALSPDVASSIVGGLLTPLKNFQIHALDQAKLPPPDCTPQNIIKNTPASAVGVAGATELYARCLSDFVRKSRRIYLQLEPMVSPDSHSNEAIELASTNFQILCDKMKLEQEIGELAAEEIQLSNSIGAVGKYPTSSTDARPLSVTNTAVEKLVAALAVTDGIAKDLTAYRFRLEDIPSFENAGTYCIDPTKAPEDVLKWQTKDVTLFPLRDPNTLDPKLVTRQITYSIDVLNLVQNAQEAVPTSTTKKAIATVTVLYGDSKWEASVGTFFSTLPVRSFSASNGGIITQNILHPTVVPFAAANYRITKDLSWTRWRSAAYLTGAVGVNPNTVSADFAAGPSLSWRGLMVSALWHYGHDTRLTQGFKVGGTLPSSYSGKPPNETFWTSSFAVGIAVRVPSLTGR